MAFRATMNVLRSTHCAYLAIVFMALSACSGGEGASGTTTPGPAPSLVADAGRDQSVFVGTFVTLNGSKSTNANQTGLIYAWTLAKPATSNATLSNPTSVNPTLTVDVEGTYEATLIVTDAQQTSLSSAPDTVLVTAAKSNLPPTADAGDNRDVFVDRPVSLDGSGSRASNNKQLTFNWSFKDRPAGSTSTLSNPTAEKPSFTPDTSGPYVLQLIVNDGTNSSTAAEVTITAAVKPRPTANAGPNQSATPGTLITLDGSKSSSATRGPLTFRWSLTVPQGSTATLAKADTPSPTFTADQLGTYVAQLIVNDGTDDSTPATAQINVSSTLPLANAGAAQTVSVCRTVTLNGSESRTRSGGSIAPDSYSWSFESRPANSAAVLSNTTAVSPSFTADMAGDYRAKLIVKEGTQESSPSFVLVKANFTYIAGLVSTNSLYTDKCDSCHLFSGNFDENNKLDLSKKGLKVNDRFRNAGNSVSHKGIPQTVTLPENNQILDLCVFSQEN